MDYLEIKDLTLTYYNKKTKELVVALDNISTSFELGKTTVIVGKIGSGKSTLLKIIGGILPYDNGTLLYKGRDLDNIYIEDRNFAYVSQDISLFPKKTVFDNLALPLINKKIKKEKIREIIYETSREFGIDYLLTRKPKEISVGQMQKVNLLKAFLRDPELYLLDEPFSNLDIKTTLNLRLMLKKMLKKKNATCIFVTHNINDALFLADDMLVIKDGHIICSGNKDLVFHSNKLDVVELLHAEELNNEKN